MDLINDFYKDATGGLYPLEGFFMKAPDLLTFCLKNKVCGFGKLKHLSDAVHKEWLANGKLENFCLVALPPKGATDEKTKASFYQALRNATVEKSKHTYPAEVAVWYLKKKYVEQKTRESNGK